MVLSKLIVETLYRWKDLDSWTKVVNYISCIMHWSWLHLSKLFSCPHDKVVVQCNADLESWPLVSCTTGRDRVKRGTSCGRVLLPIVWDSEVQWSLQMAYQNNS